MKQKIYDIFKLNILNSKSQIKRFYKILNKYNLTKSEKDKLFIEIKNLFEDRISLKNDLVDSNNE